MAFLILTMTGGKTCSSLAPMCSTTLANSAIANILSRIPCFAIWETVSSLTLARPPDRTLRKKLPIAALRLGTFSTTAALTRWSRFLAGRLKFCATSPNTGNHWILFKLVGTKSNRMGIGAQIHILTEDGASQWNEVTTAVGYTASSDSRVHFGLGKNRLIKDVEIRWPSGIKQVLHDVAADQILTVEEPQR